MAVFRPLVRPILRPAFKPVPRPSPHLAANAGYVARPVHAPKPFVGGRSPYGMGMKGIDDGELAAMEVDAPLLQQEVRFDAPSLTLFMGTNKIAIVPALVSALIIRMIMMGGAKASGLLGFGAHDAKPAKARR